MAALIYSGIKYNQLKDANGDLRKVEQRRNEAEEQLLKLYHDQADANYLLSKVKEDIQNGHEQISDIQIELAGLHVAQDTLNSSLETTRGQVESQLNLLQTYESMYLSTKQMHEERCQKAKEEADNKISLTEQECAKLIDEKRAAAQIVVDQFSANAENERQKYLSIIATIANAQSDEEQNLQRHICVKELAQDDIGYLLNNVVHHLSNPDILYKLIWSEYVQKPTNEMLDYVLPNKDCPGIYKITNDRNKKSYIGRSTSVRKRLTDHVKSAVGISTIASQKIHDIMREEGLWNFTFELIEECDKDKLSEREKYYIDFFQTADTIYGYNQKAGG